MDKEKILELLNNTYSRAKEEDSYFEKCILYQAVIEVILEREGFIEIKKIKGVKDEKRI